MKIAFVVAACVVACAMMATVVLADPDDLDCEATDPNSEATYGARMPSDCRCKQGCDGPNRDGRGSPCLPVQVGCCIPTALINARRYNAFFSENFVSNFSDVQGGLAVGGNMTIMGFEINGQKDPYFALPGVKLEPCEVGGWAFCNLGVSLRGGNLVYGIHKGSKVTQDLDVSYDKGTTFGPVLTAAVGDQPATPRNIDFEESTKALKKWSQDLAKLPDTGSYTIDTFGDWRKVNFTGDNGFRFNVFSINCSLLTLADRHLSNVPEGSKVLFNIRCGADYTNTHWKFVQDSLPTGKHKIIWNFVDATTLLLEGINIKGIVLAPLAHIKAGPSGGLIEGQVFAKSFGPDGGIQTGGTIQFNLIPYPGDFIPDCDDEAFTPTECVPACGSNQYCDKSNPSKFVCVDCICEESTDPCEDAKRICSRSDSAPYHTCTPTPKQEGSPCSKPGETGTSCVPTTTASSAVAGPKSVSSSSSVHAFYLPGLWPSSNDCGSGNSDDLAGSNSWFFVKGTTPSDECYPKVVVNSTGLRLTGCIELGAPKKKPTFSEHRFYVDVQFEGKANTPPLPSGSPKKELLKQCYNATGCGPSKVTVDVNSFSYYTVVAGTLTTRPREKGFTGNPAILRLKRMGPAAQAGVGANGKNLNYGLSTWFTWEWDNKSPPFTGQNPKCKCRDVSSGHGDINIDINTLPCPPSQVGVCINKQCTSVTCPNFDTDAVGTYRLRNAEGKSYGLALNGLGDSDSARKQYIWNFEYSGSACTSDVKMAVTAAAGNGDKTFRIYGTACGGPLLSDGVSFDGGIRAGILDITVENTRKYSSNGGGCRAEANQHVSYGRINDTKRNQVFELRTSGSFEVKRSINIFSGGCEVKHTCQNTVLSISKLDFLVGACLSPVALLGPSITSCTPTQSRSILQVTAGPWDTITSTVQLTTGFSTLGFSGQMSDTDFARQFTADLVSTQSRLEGDESRLTVLSVYESGGRTTVTYRVTKSRNNTREFAYRNSAFNVSEAIASQIRDPRSLLRRGVVTVNLDGTVGVSAAVTPGTPNPGSGDEMPSSSSGLSATQIGAIAGAGGVVLLVIAVVVGIKLRRRSQADAKQTAGADFERSSSQVSMSSLAMIPEEPAKPVRQSPFKFPEPETV